MFSEELQRLIVKWISDFSFRGVTHPTSVLILSIIIVISIYGLLFYINHELTQEETDSDKEEE